MKIICLLSLIAFGYSARLEHGEKILIALEVPSLDPASGGIWDKLDPIKGSIEKAKHVVEEMANKIGSKFDEIKNTVHDISAFLTNTTSFVCQNQSCELCFTMPIKGQKSEVCANIILNLEAYSVKGEILFNDEVIIEKFISAENPRPVCARSPFSPLIKFQLCITPYEQSVNTESKDFKVCLETTISAFSERVISIDLNCFQLENGKDFYLAKADKPTKKAIVNLNAGKFIPDFENKKKLFSV